MKKCGIREVVREKTRVVTCNGILKMDPRQKADKRITDLVTQNVVTLCYACVGSEERGYQLDPLEGERIFGRVSDKVTKLVRANSTGRVQKCVSILKRNRVLCVPENPREVPKGQRGIKCKPASMHLPILFSPHGGESERGLAYD